MHDEQDTDIHTKLNQITMLLWRSIVCMGMGWEGREGGCGRGECVGVIFVRKYRKSKSERWRN